MHLVEFPPDQVQVSERHRAAFLDHHPGGTTEGPDPFAELLGVGNGCGQADHRHRQREVDEDLLPHRSPVGVLEVMDLVEHNDLEPLQRGAAFVEHVAKDLRGHDHDGCLRVDRVVPGQQADPRRPVLPREVTELLVGEGLEGRGVERLAVVGQGSLHGELGHHRLAGARRSGHQDGLSGIQRLHGLDLVVV